jgi:hypothetical protein
MVDPEINWTQGIFMIMEGKTAVLLNPTFKAEANHIKVTLPPAKPEA